MAKSVPDKIGVKENMRAIFINAPPETLKDIDSPLVNLEARLSGKFDYIHLFVKNQGEFHIKFPKMTNHLSRLECFGCPGQNRDKKKLISTLRPD